MEQLEQLEQLRCPIDMHEQLKVRVSCPHSELFRTQPFEHPQRKQTCNIAFVKTHKTASTTAATIFYRYGKRHNLNVANFDGHQSSIELQDAVKHVTKRRDIQRGGGREGARAACWPLRRAVHAHLLLNSLNNSQGCLLPVVRVKTWTYNRQALPRKDAAPSI